MTALITGASGFVGQHLEAHLRALGESPVVLPPTLDIADRRALSKALAAFSSEPVDAIYHLAALAHVADSFDSSEEVFRVNAVGTLNLLESARNVLPQAKILYVSSSEVYGIVDPQRLPVDENGAVEPLSPYAVSKAAAEQICLQAFRAHSQKVLVVRPFNHIGPGQSDNYVVSALAKRVLVAKREGRKSIVVGNLSSKRDFTDVRDVVNAYRLLIELGTPGSIYNVCSGRSVSINELAMKMIELADVDLKLERDSDLVRDVEVSDIYGDCSKCHAELGWKPTVAIEQSLKDVLAWWRSRLGSD